MSKRGLTIAVAVWSSLLVSACGSTGPPTRPGATLIPTIVPRTGDSFLTFDFAVEGDSLLHLVWCAAPPQVGRDRPAGVGEPYYQRCDLRRSRWSEPVHLPFSPWVYRNVRVAVTGNTLHIVARGRDQLCHLISADDGRSWQTLPPVLPPPSSGDRFELATTRRGLTLVFVEPEPTALGTRTVLWATMWDRSSWSPPARVATLDSGTVLQAGPEVVVASESLLVFYATGQLVRTGHNGDPTFRGSATLWTVLSKDDGLSWSGAHELRSRGDGRAVRGTAAVTSIAAVTLNGRLLLPFTAQDLAVTECEHDGSWSPAVPLAKVPPSLLEKAEWAKSVRAVAIGSKGQLVWIDSRYCKTDRPPFTPPGGLPWSARGDWVNNDLLAIPLSELGGSLGGAGNLRPNRLTRNLTYADQVLVRAGDRSIYVVWSGIPQVGKTMSAVHDPPALWLMVLPPE